MLNFELYQADPIEAYRYTNDATGFSALSLEDRPDETLRRLCRKQTLCVYLALGCHVDDELVFTPDNTPLSLEDAIRGGFAALA